MHGSSNSVFVQVLSVSFGNVMQSKDAAMVQSFFLFFPPVWPLPWLALFLLLNHGVVEDNTADPCLCSQTVGKKEKYK